jgi:L-threonylcarbamoyladenylate synthase
MIIIDYTKKHHIKIITACVLALKQGRVVAYPTDTSYGLAADASNVNAIKSLYEIKGRNFNKPSSVVVPFESYVKKLVKLNKTASVLIKKFWPGALTVALGYSGKGIGYRKLCSVDGFLSLRMPKNQIALDLSIGLKKPITATSANLAGQPDCYSADEIIKQFKNEKLKPDIIINSGKLPKRKPSTVVKIVNDEKIEIIRQGPVTEKQIVKVLGLRY